MAKRYPFVAVMTTLSLIAGIEVVGYDVVTRLEESRLRVTADEDTYIHSEARDEAFGQESALAVGQETNAGTYVTYLKFTVPDLPGLARVERVTLRLVQRGADDARGVPSPVALQSPMGPAVGDAGQRITLWETQHVEWTDATLTVDEAPYLSAPLQIGRVDPRNGVLEFDLTDTVTRPGGYTFALTAEQAGAVWWFRSTEHEDATAAPTLDIELGDERRQRAPSLPDAEMGTWVEEAAAGVTTAARTPCPVSDRLVPRCGVWWGVAPGAYTNTPPHEALRVFERKSGRHADVFHTYHRGDELFPTEHEIAAVREPGRERVLFVNWKVAWNTTWAAVAQGRQDERIDRLAAYVRRVFPERFFLAIHHEPENEVNPNPSSGMTASDYAAMFRHTVQRLRTAGVTNAVTVMVYTGYERWGTKRWFNDLYPGDDVVDWIGFDPYVTARRGAYHYGDFSRMVNLTGSPHRWPGFYNWVTRAHPNKPLMLAEWGVFEYAPNPSRKAWIYQTVGVQLRFYPAIRALIYFDSPRAPRGNTAIDSSPEALRAFRELARRPVFNVQVP